MTDRNEGRLALLVVIRTTTQAAIALRVGVTQSSVSRWCAGKSRPDPRSRRVLADEYGIPVDAWSNMQMHV